MAVPAMPLSPIKTPKVAEAVPPRAATGGEGSAQGSFGAALENADKAAMQTAALGQAPAATPALKPAPAKDAALPIPAEDVAMPGNPAPALPEPKPEATTNTDPAALVPAPPTPADGAEVEAAAKPQPQLQLPQAAAEIAVTAPKAPVAAPPEATADGKTQEPRRTKHEDGHILPSVPTGLQDMAQPVITAAVPPQPVVTPALMPVAAEVVSFVAAAPHETASKPVDHTGPDQVARPNGEAPAPETRVSAPLFSQTLETANARPAALPYAPAQAETSSTTVALREGRFGADVGVSIARALGGGQNGEGRDLLIRIDPRHMGRIDVRMSFDHDGVLRAVVSADSPAALDMLRRESADLSRALTDAGVRSDPQSLRFDSSAGGSAGGQSRQGQRTQAQGPDYRGGFDLAGSGDDIPIHRSLRGSGHVDLMA
ncbi:hypothetical protein V474_24370 [Novosphingobium barchaimii LL02]|uniref:Flagellar hook-length control protein-like C-terminal domain-containing protein n=1 Tax=Novosphingobium barchaimii LL02 TaxID=1114963 RepID=A0A0J7XMT4_9SPHN|nr:flagellar hook-length control protein FliK [Novosphingobium barchaimii]KMS52944.1 hypothetical protein V474_24370 [Novosphingobium barchaimii LL02]